MEVFQVQGNIFKFKLPFHSLHFCSIRPTSILLVMCDWHQPMKFYCANCDDSIKGGWRRLLTNVLTLINGNIASQVDEPDSRILVEMSRSFGDPVLYLKPKGDGDLPIEIDFYKCADVTSFQNRLSHHHIYGTGWGYYFIGVYNNDACMEEDTYFNLSISIAPSSLKTVALCPLNCSYPNGKCTEDGNCSCESGFGGSYCEGCESLN